MDTEFHRQLSAVISGDVSGDAEAREIILNARTAYRAKLDVIESMRRLLLQAEEAFISGPCEPSTSPG